MGHPVQALTHRNGLQSDGQCASTEEYAFEEEDNASKFMQLISNFIFTNVMSIDLTAF